MKKASALTAGVFLLLNCTTSLQLQNIGNGNYLIAEFNTVSNTTPIFQTDKEYVGGNICLENIETGVKYCSRRKDDQKRYIVFENIPKGTYAIHSLRVPMINVDILLLKEDELFNEIQIDKPGVYLLGKADFRAKLHGICCDTLEIQKGSQTNFLKSFSEHYGTITDNIDTTQNIFSIAEIRYFQYDSLNLLNNKKGFQPFVPSGKGRRKIKAY
ncbi:MAG: hypothetical protein GX556_10300 [Fibrobacter sp.]|nr:hypothetical protein [Fibrobacter sp.]